MHSVLHQPNNFTRRIPFVLLALLLATGFTACLADIRPEGVKDRPQPNESEKARAILRQSANASHAGGNGFALWRGQSGASVKLTDEWFGLAKMSNNWPLDNQPLRISFMPAADDSVVEFLKEDGTPTGLVWGIHDWNTWTRRDGQLEYKPDERIHFNLPTVQYFMEAPYRLEDDSALIDYAGIQQVGDTKYHVVYVTWGAMEAQDMIDQYVAYVNVENKRVERIDCTVRDSMPFVTISAYYQDYRDVQGFQLPHRILITGLGKPDDTFHIYHIDEWRTNIGLARTTYAPENRPPRAKY